MKCKNIENLLAEYIEDALSPRQRLIVSDHLSNCDRCSKSEQILREQILSLNHSLKAAANSCPDYPDLSRKVISSLQESARVSHINRISLRLAFRSSFSFAALAVITAAAAFLFFQGILSSDIAGAPKLSTGRQQAFTAQPRIDGRVDSGIILRRYASLHTIESWWPR